METIDRVEHARQLLRKTAGFNSRAEFYKAMVDGVTTALRKGMAPEAVQAYGAKFGKNKKAAGLFERAFRQVTGRAAPAIDVASLPLDAGGQTLTDFMKQYGKHGKTGTAVPGSAKLKEWWGKKFDPNLKNTSKAFVAKSVGAGAAAGYGINTIDPTDKELSAWANKSAPTASEQAAFKEGVGQRRTKAPANASLPPELLAGAGGAVAGGALGYAVAPTLGISRGVGAVGGATLSAIASALLANHLKGPAAPAV